ncbi:MAG: transglycosylase domain-containing protein [Hyphomicrobiales bacterium]
MASIGAAAAVGALFIAYNTYAEGYVPIEQKLTERYVGLTEIYDRGGPKDGVYLGSLDNPQGQLLHPVQLDQISPYMVQATVSTEDNTFWENPGVNPKGILRAAWENYVGGGIGTGSGGSSITQQLIKTVYLTTDCEIVDGTRVCTAPRTLDRKLKEIAYSFELERDADKSQIIEWYLNSISYADRYVGVEAAARGYFRKPAKDLTLGEAALLAGIPAAPTKYHPRLNCVRDDSGNCIVDELGRTTVAGDAKKRQEYVLDLMVQHQRATPEEAAAAKAEVIKVYPAADSVKASAWIESQVEPRLVRMCEAGMLPMTPGTDNCVDSVHSGGYKVTTTLDWEMTQAATAMMNEYIAKGLAAGCECHNAAITTIEPSTGQVLVYAPNIDPTYVSDPRVAGNIDQLTEINQPGSSFKPAVYLAWLDKLNKTPLSSIWDTSPMPISPPGTPKEDQVTIVNPRPGGGGEGLITMRAAMGGSQNVPAFRAATEVGIDNVIAMAKALGITTLDQGFDPTFRDHEAVHYGASIATGGANIRAIDMAYMNATISNMGAMVGVPTLAQTIDPKDLKSLAGAEGDDYDEAMMQKLQFTRGHIRLPGTRPLDPVVVLKVEGIDGRTLYEEGPDLQRIQMVNPGSVWMLHTVMSDCTARFIIWPCGTSNDDLALDAFMDGWKIPEGIKTGTQQGFLNPNDTLATWMNGYSRYAATAVWVGNADKSLVRDGPSGNYASANTTIRLFKHWMERYHLFLRDRGVFDVPAGFEDVQPANVVYKPFQTATTERGRRGGCNQMIEGWQRTDVEYKGDCEGKGYVPLPAFKPELAIALARARGIPIGPQGGQVSSPRGGDTGGGATPPATTTPVPTRPSGAEPTPTQPRPTQPAATPPATQPPATQPPATQPPAPDRGNDGGGGRGRGGARGGRGN